MPPPLDTEDQSFYGPGVVYECGSTECSNATIESITQTTSSGLDGTGGSDDGSEDGDIAFDGSSIAIGAIGVIFTAACITFVIRRRKRNTEMNNGNLKPQGSTKWWNKLSVPKIGTSELSAGQGRYDTAELPGEDGQPIFELPAGSIRSGHERDRKRSVSEIGSSEGHGIRTPSTHSAASSGARDTGNDAESSDESPVRETTTLLRSVSVVPSPRLSSTTTTNLRKSISSPAPRQAPAVPTVRVSLPAPSAPSEDLVGAFAPRPLSETDFRVLAGMEARLPPSKPTPKPSEDGVYK